METPEASITYFVSKILVPILEKPFEEYKERVPKPFEDFMETLPVPSTKPPVVMSKSEFVNHAEPCLVREAFQSVRAEALLFNHNRAISYNFDVSSHRSHKFATVELSGIRKYQLHVTRTNVPPGFRQSFFDDDWNIKLVLIMSGPAHGPKMQLGFVHRGIREKLYPSARGRSRYRVPGTLHKDTRVSLDLWLSSSTVFGQSDHQRIVELTPFMSVYRQCWALSVAGDQTTQLPYSSSYLSSVLSYGSTRNHNAPLLDVFLSLPPNSYRSISHNFSDQHDELLKNLNSTQRQVVKDFAYTVTSTSYQSDKHFVLGLQGPPGTGKSETIVALVKLLLKVKPNIKILIAAPSNAAVDSVGRRVAALREVLVKKKVKKAAKDINGVKEEIEVEEIEYSDAVYDILRLGYSHAISPDMKEFMLDRKLPQFLKWNGSYLNETVKGNIFLSTLNSCASYKTTKIHELVRFDVVLVDEAGQALQLDTLIPVTILGMTKMILIGDQNQLQATVLDEKNVKVDFARSWIERISMNFENNISEMLPMLDVQYRMHPHICAFPSREFYRGRLKTGLLVIDKSKDWKLQPLKFFNLIESKESSEGTSKYNEKEIAFIGELLSECMKHENSQLKYAVITGYTAQQKLLLCHLKSVGLGDVRVSTVDSFQGQENEVIIVSCVRAGGRNIGFLNDRKRVNVALTRAQHSVFIVGHRDTLEVHSIWNNFFNQPELGKNVVVVPKKYSMSKIVKDHVLKPVAADFELDLQKLSIAA